MNIVTKIKGWLGRAEGSWAPAFGRTHWGTMFQVDFGDGFQNGVTLNNVSGSNVPVAYACVMAIARAISVCTPQHTIFQNGAREKSTTSPASRVLRKPNSYQTWAQFILNAVAMMLFYGESFIQVVRDDRNAVVSLHILPRGSCMPYVATDGSIFYSIGENPMNPGGNSYMAPARDILHLRQYCPRHPLIGESALTAAALALGVNVALSGNQAAFYSNMNRPSGILSTDEKLTRDQIQMLRTAFDEQAKGLNSGKVPILAAGLKFQPMGINSQDSQVVEAQRLSIEEVARVFGVPLPIIGELGKANTGNTESTINFWLATGLGSTLAFLEQSLSNTFGLPATETIEFDTRALLRLDYQSRIESLAKGVQGGILTPNEARKIETLPPVTDGDKVFLQQQMVPIDLLTALHAAQAAAPAATPSTPEGEDPPDDEPDADVSRSLVIDMFTRKRA